MARDQNLHEPCGPWRRKFEEEMAREAVRPGDRNDMPTPDGSPCMKFVIGPTNVSVANVVPWKQGES